MGYLQDDLAASSLLQMLKFMLLFDFINLVKQDVGVFFFLH